MDGFAACLPPARPAPGAHDQPLHPGGTMKKLMLDMDALQVEAFTTAERASGTGTVHAHATVLHCSTRCDTDGITCDGGNTCDGAYTCGGEITCALSCAC
jgi:hypothetical protein